MRLLATIGLVIILLLAVTGQSATTGPPAPTNLAVVSATQDSITLAWGPSQPGEFYGISEGKNALTLGWGASSDTRSAVTYTLTKNGVTLASGLTATRYTVTGLNRKVATFRTCVVAQGTAGSSPPMCATWTR